MLLFISIYLFISMLIVFKDRELIKDGIEKHEEELNEMSRRQHIACMIYVLIILTITAIPLEIKLLYKRFH